MYKLPKQSKVSKKHIPKRNSPKQSKVSKKHIPNEIVLNEIVLNEIVLNNQKFPRNTSQTK